MAIYTNYPYFRGAFGDQLRNIFKSANSVTIASGYTSEITVKQYQEYIEVRWRLRQIKK